MNQAMQQLRALQTKLYALQYAINMIDYDAQTAAPAESWQGRSEAMEVLTGEKYALIADPGLPALFAEARRQALSEQEAAEVAELERQYSETSKVPAAEYAAFAKLTSQAVNAWEKAKAASDFAAFAPYLQKIVDARRRFAFYYDPQKPAYDVWLDQYEKGLTAAQCDAFFDQLQAAIVPLVKAIAAKAQPAAPAFLQGPWPAAQQRRLSGAVMELLGIDRGHCQIGESAHPFTTEFFKGDVRITTRYDEADMLSSMYSVIHESGHALYELHIADRLHRTCLSAGASMGMHESQSRLFENYFGRSLPFIEGLWPRLTALFPAQLQGVSTEQFWRAANRCQPSLIRTEADEVTYCLHIILRYRLEKQLIEGTLAVKDLPAAWNALMEQLLGVQVPCDAQGVLQDIHWACGDFGYFASYALGSAYAAQIAASMRRELELDNLLRQGDFGPILQWLTQRIWQYGKEKSPAWLLENACGAPFDPRFYTEYLTHKYSALYGL